MKTVEIIWIVLLFAVMILGIGAAFGRIEGLQRRVDRLERLESMGCGGKDSPCRAGSEP